jgi:hypothetical protein
VKYRSGLCFLSIAIFANPRYCPIAHSIKYQPLLSTQRNSAINGHYHSRNKRCRRQKEHCFGDIAGRAMGLQWDVLGSLTNPRRIPIVGK